VLTSEPHQIWKQAVFAIISFLGGVSFAVPMATIMAGVINSALSLLTPPVTIEVSPNIGALVAASISVAILLRILSKSKNGSLPGLDGVMNDMGFADASRKRGGLPADNVPSDVLQ
jgi:hypothetical protein